MKKISVEGGTAVTLCDAPEGGGASWSENGTIAFVPGARTALSQVSSGGGVPRPLTVLDPREGEVTHVWPQWLPGSKAVLFTSSGQTTNFEDADIVAYTISSGQRKTVLHGGYYARYLPGGHILYMHEGTLFLLPFDPRSLQVTGTPVPVHDGISANPADGSAQFSVSDKGTMAYMTALVPIMIAYNGFQYLGQIAGEIRDPQKTIPRAAILGVSAVVLLYFLINVVYFRALGFSMVSHSQHVASDAVVRIAGPDSARWLTVVMIVSALGSLHASFLARPRVLYAMARDG